MSIWDRVLALLGTSPFSGAWMSMGTAVAFLAGLKVVRRMLPPEDRHHGGVTFTFLVIGLGLCTLRLGFIAAGAGESAGGRAVAVLATFLVAMGGVGTVVMALLEVVPARARVEVPSILRDLVFVLAFGVIVFGLLSESGVNVLSLVTTSAVLTAVVGLALQGTITNLFAGIILHMDRALNVGDWVQVGQRIGRITQMGWRATVLSSRDGDTVIIPNGQLTSQEVYNFSRPSARHRVSLRVGFHYRHPPNQVRAVAREAVAGTPGVLPEPAPDVFPMEFGDSAVIYNIRFWLDEFQHEHDIKGEVLTRVWYAARRTGLEIPFPIRTLVTVPAETQAAREESETAARIDALARIDLFAPLDPADREALARGLKQIEFAAGEAIIRQGAAGDSLFIIAKGVVAVSLGHDGAAGDLATLVATLGPGDCFGEMSLMTGENRTATCIAQTDVACYELGRATFHKVLAARPQIADQMSALLAGRQATLARKGSELSARAANAGEVQQRLLQRIRAFFALS